MKQPLYYHDDTFATYHFGEGHPFSPVRQNLTVDLLFQAGLLKDDAVTPPVPVDDDILAYFHAADYVAAVKEAVASKPQLHYGLGTSDNPIFPDMHRASALRVGATMDAVRRVMNGNTVKAANFAGGLHHAHRDRASGFCIYNDAAVAIAWLRRHFDARIAYIDVDAHHGDGVQWGFYDDPQVLTVSIHENPATLFPGTGFTDEIGEGSAKGTSVNIPLQAGTEGEEWSECFDAVVPDVVRAFQPDIIISQHGCDAHRLDPLSHLSVDVHSLIQAAKTIRQLADDLCEGRWVALGGGGYAVWQVVPRAWALVWATLCGHDDVTGPLPPLWEQRWAEEAPCPLPTRWYDAIDNTPIRDGDDFDAQPRQHKNLTAANDVRRVALSYLKR